MDSPTLNYVSCPDAAGGHRMAYWQWGVPEAAHVVVCVHGLSRQGRDFDVLARALVAAAPGPLRVVCPDVVGRGKSDWLAEPMGYQLPLYASDMLAMVAQLHALAPLATLDWVGTSMGGLIGMCIAGTPGAPLPAPIRKLVLNDVGPVIQWEALQRIGIYLGRGMRFSSVDEAAAAMWAISQGFGPHTPEQWRALSEPMLKATDDGGWVLHYDPAIAVPFRTVTAESAQQGEAALWALYDAVRADTLLMRGSDSDLLSPATAQAMAGRGPHARLVEFTGVGHAPTLIARDQVRAVTSFLFGGEASDEEPRNGAG